MKVWESMIYQGIDMEDYVKRRLTEITDTDERSFAREALLKGLLPAIQVMEARYRELEDRVRRETEPEDCRYAVQTMVIRQQDYDPSNRTWFPVCEQDVRQGGKTYKRIYFQGGRAERLEFEALGSLTAVDALGGTHRVGIRKTEDYRNAVEALYQIFVYNRIPWSTVNTGDMERFYDLYPLVEQGETENAEKEEAAGQEEDIITQTMEDWSISFGRWENRVCQDAMLLWNIEKFRFRCMKFMVPCLDGKYYEHELELEDQDEDTGYMVEGNEDILSVRYEKGKIIMTSVKETFDNWCAYRFVGRADMDSYGYQGRILGNRKKERFADCLIRRYGQGIHSKTEIFRLVEELDLGGVIRITDCQVQNCEREGSFPADMNWFIREEAFPMETRRILELRFAGQVDGEADVYRMEDMLRYAVSQIQLFLDEYKCVGVLA